jgi:penicillin amidase
VKLHSKPIPCPSIHAATPVELTRKLGEAHARDRGLQMLMMRILGSGRACEFLDGGDETLAVDRFFRRMNWTSGTVRAAIGLSPSTRERVQAYCDGVNAQFKRKLPWELKALGYRKHETWKPEDCVLVSRMAGYLSLAQSQGEVERLVIEAVQGGVSREALEELFPDLLTGLDDELMNLIRKVPLTDRLVPEGVRWNPALPRMMASNNWVVSGRHSASGFPLLANDPHLETNRLPNIWYEIGMSVGGKHAHGVTMPGIPVLLVGRNEALAWGVTYTFMDSVDSWIEHCRDGKYMRETADGGTEWLPFRRREEKILRKGREPSLVVFFDNEHGTLDGEPPAEGEGYRLATRWSGAEVGAESLEGGFEIFDATTVEQARAALGRLEVSFNWVLADRQGDIGYQMSGLMPRRREGRSGLIPLPGWKRENDWQGYVPAVELPRALNPETGFFVTANQDLNRYGVASPINSPMADYRVQRIEQLLTEEIASGRKLTPEKLGAMQMDAHSVQAERFMKEFRPLLPALPPSTARQELENWDLSYEPGSRGAFVFEQVYRALMGEVFGAGGLGEAYDLLSRETGIFIDFYGNFDRVLLAPRSVWFGSRSREQIFRTALEKGLAVKPRRWGDVNRITLSHMLLGGKVPRWLGFDRGPIEIRGGRSTIHQGQIYRSANRVTSFIPSFRMVTDLGAPVLFTALAGGPKDRRFSKEYNCGTEAWLRGEFAERPLES